MNFDEWLKQNEARGAFGNNARMMAVRNPKPQTPLKIYNGENSPTQRQDNRFQDFDKRVQYGKGIEKQIFDSLVACGMKLTEPTTRQDMFDKIDAWWNINGRNEPLQIKYRDTGSDILFEVMKDYQKNIPGRDMVGKAKFYAVMTGNTIVVVQVDEAKQLIQNALEKVQISGFDQRGNFFDGGLTLKVRPDPQSGQDKLMAYIPVKLLKNVQPPCNSRVNF